MKFNKIEILNNKKKEKGKYISLFQFIFFFCKITIDNVFIKKEIN